MNALPIKYIIDRPLWKTEDIKLNITIPYEYMQFINEVKQTVPSSASIFSLPYNQASYSFIKDQNSDNIFSGTSPIKIFTGITEYSGNLSFPPNESVNINKAIINRDYNTLNSILSKYNISYLIVTKNIPSEVLNSYLFDLYSIKEQDSNLIDAISKRKLHVSSNGNYELYQLKTNSNILRSGNIYFKKRNQIEYHIHLSNIKEAQVVAFVDSFHPGWELYLSKHSNNECNDVYKYSEEGRECRTDTQLMNWNEPNILFAKPLFKQTHTQYQQFGNQWKISMDELKNNRLIKSSPDGKYDLDLILYFRPQAFFYIGILISTVSILILTLLILVRKKK